MQKTATTTQTPYISGHLGPWSSYLQTSQLNNTVSRKKGLDSNCGEGGTHISTQKAFEQTYRIDSEKIKQERISVRYRPTRKLSSQNMDLQDFMQDYYLKQGSKLKKNSN